MFRLYQSPGGAVEPKDSNSLEVTLRELREKTALRIYQLRPKWIGNNPKFDCDIYAVKAPLSFVRRSGPDFFSSLAADSKSLVFLWITKNLSVSQPFLKARQVGIS